ncbi:MAG: radical SAM protein [Nitrospirota bacterium]
MKSPSFIQFYPTLRCNQNCCFCFNRGIPNPSPYGDMTYREGKRLLALMKESVIEELDILGGEPLLVSWIPGFVREATDSGISVNISTNGSLPDVIADLLKIETNLLNIGFSIHGLPETHDMLSGADNFPKAVTGVRSVIEKGEKPVVKSVLTRRNMDRIHDLVLYLAGLGVTRYYLLYEDTIGRRGMNGCLSFPEFHAFYAKLRGKVEGAMDIGFVAASGFHKHNAGRDGVCDAGGTKIALLPDGSAFPCNLFFGFDEFRLGNIFADGIERIWHSPVLDVFRKMRRKRCGREDCRHHPTCSGGCPAHSYFFYGTIEKPDPRCMNFNPNIAIRDSIA